MDIKFKKLSEDAVIPTKAHPTDIGLDLYSLEDVELKPGIPTKIKTGISCGFPKGIAGLILDRSSMGVKGIKVLGGVIDQAYTGELLVCLIALDAQTISAFFPKGSKIAQLVLIPSYEVAIIEVDQLEATDRGDKGFGSSGK